MSLIEIKNYSDNLWGRDIKTLYNINKVEAEEFLKIAGQTDMSMARKIFPFKELQEAMIQARKIFPFKELQEAMIQVKKGEIKEPNAVIRISAK